MNINKQFKLASRPVGKPTRENWDFVESSMPVPAEDEVLVKILYISLDPAMRGWMNEGKSYIRPVNIGEVMRAGTIGKVIESNSPHYKPGDYVNANLGVQEYAAVAPKFLTKIDETIASLPTFLGTLGMPGLTGYFGLMDIGAPKEGETVVVSGAAGAVGSVVGQIAKIKGCRVVGIAGGTDKCKYVVDELGYDACIDYKNENIKSGLKTHCPNGVDIYFDNVGGDILDAVLTQLALNARIIICGAISQYNNTTPMKGPSNYMSLLVNRAKMQGMVVFDYASQYSEGIRQMAQWLQQGKLTSREHIVKGLENFPETLLMLFSGENFGKLVLQIAEDN